MEETRAESLLDKIKPPRLEDAGLEDCALPPELIKEAFLKAASAVRSIVSASDGEDDYEYPGRCVNDPPGDSSDVLVGIMEGVSAPSEGCTVEKGGLTEAPGDSVVSVGGGGSDGESKPDVVVAPGPTGDEPACGVGLGVEGNDNGSLGKKGDADAAEDDAGENEKGEPTLVGGYV